MSAPNEIVPDPQPATPVTSLDALRLRLAAQIANRRWSLYLTRIAARHQSGQTLEACVRREQMPAELKSLLVESLSYREPTVFVLDTLRGSNQLKQSWGQFSNVIIYPMLLLALAVFGGAWFSFQLRGMNDWSLFDNSYELPKLAEDQHHAIVGAAIVFGWTSLMFVLLRWLAPGWAWTAVVGSLMLVGRPTRWLRLQEILLRFQAVAAQGVADGQLANAVARSFADSGQEMVTLQIARRIQAGMPVGQALASTGLSDGLCAPTLLLLDQHSSGQFADQCGQSAELMGRLVQQRCKLMSLLVPVLVIVIVGSIVWSILSSYLQILLFTVYLLTVWW